MTLNDKSSPDDIKATFGISKGQFKESTRWLDEGWQNQARPVWDRVDLGLIDMIKKLEEMSLEELWQLFLFFSSRAQVRVERLV